MRLTAPLDLAEPPDTGRRECGRLEADNIVLSSIPDQIVVIMWSSARGGG